jgi:hypothetical protein
LLPPEAMGAPPAKPKAARKAKEPDDSIQAFDNPDPYFTGSDRFIMPDSYVLTRGKPTAKLGHTAFTRQKDGTWALTSTNLADALKKKGKGLEMIVAGLKEAERRGVPEVVGDKSVSAEHIQSMRSAKAKGIIDFDEADSAAFDEAVANQSRATLNQPAFRNIRLGPTE